MTLFPGCLLQVVNGLQVVLLANLVKFLDQLGLAGNAQLFAFGEPQLLVDQVAEQVLVRCGDLLHRLLMLPAHLVHIGHGALVVRSGDDLIVHAGNNALGHDSAIGAGRLVGLGARQGVTREQPRDQPPGQNCAERERRDFAKKSWSHSLGNRLSG